MNAFNLVSKEPYQNTYPKTFVIAHFDRDEEKYYVDVAQLRRNSLSWGKGLRAIKSQLEADRLEVHHDIGSGETEFVREL